MAAKQVKQARAVRELYIDQIYSAHVLAQSAALDNSLHGRLKAICSKIDQVYSEFEKVHISLINALVSAESPELDDEKQVRKEFLDKYYEIKEIYEGLFNSRSQSQTNSNNDNVVAKLPKINLPIFDGTFTQWPTFIELFNSLIHNNNSLDNIQKFNYLITSLKNEPLTLVKALPLLSDNYEIAYDSLVKRYQNPRLLSNTYWSKISNAKKITKDSASSLRGLLTVFNENLAALKNLGLPVKSWDFVLFNIIVQKLDNFTIQRFELQDASTEIPSYNNLVKFLEKQCTAFESGAFASTNPSSQISFNKSRNVSKHTNSFQVSTDTNRSSRHPCIVCKSTSHHIYTCSNFLSKSPYERSQFVKRMNWCTNCLHSEHDITLCGSKGLCRVCNLKHHSLLHYNRHQQPFNAESHDSKQNQPQNQSRFPPRPMFSNDTSNATASQSPINNVQPISQIQSHFPSSSNGPNALLSNIPTDHSGSAIDTKSQSPLDSTVLLATAQAEMLDSFANHQPVRILIDNGSQINIISQKCANRLGLSRSKVSLSVFGVGQAPSHALGLVSCSLRPKGQINKIFRFEAVVLPKICAEMPTAQFSIHEWKHISNLQLADPDFNKPSSVDLLLGSEVFPFILKDAIILGNNSEPSFIKTVFGWIALGKISLNHSPPIHSLCSSVESTSLDETFKKFWEIENIPEIECKSPEDILCEQHYSKTTNRDITGRYIVSLPFKEPNPVFPGSKSLALRRFYSLEKRLLNDPPLYEEYSKVMREYLDLNYMEEVPPSSENAEFVYYIPHHCVIRPSSSTTKIRVVMDASAKCASGVSLNDTLLTGSKLQKDLTSILLRFRLQPYVFTADIKQMYSQIYLSNTDIDYQRLYWRFSPDEPVKSYRLLRVAFGVKTSPFLALRTLSQLVKDEGAKFPLACSILNTDIFVDDIACSFSSLEEGIKARNQLISLLNCGGFELRKWTSNNSALLEGVPQDHLQHSPLEFTSDEFMGIKILGLRWNPKLDFFSYSVEPLERECTKRTILSELARTYDPLGFLCPLTFFAKHLIQHLWTLGLEWDEPPPTKILEKWLNYKRELPFLCKIEIPRFLFSSSTLSGQIHGFADSSEKGYAAVVYIRSGNEGNFCTFLVCAKSKVAPLKRISIPRLELCAALLLSELMAVVLKLYSSKISFENIFAWTDSSVALSWIKSSPHRWKSFVSNRVTRIQENISPLHWHHVRSEDNPADIASRGLLPSELLTSSQWWHGPQWLRCSQSSWPTSCVTVNDSGDLDEEERKIVLASFISLSAIDLLLERFSSLQKIQNIISYVLRFASNSRNPNNRRTGPLIKSELHESLLILVKRAQHIAFPEEISNIENSKPLSKTFRTLNPFIGSDGVLRVGGRLVHSGLSYDQKFPALLPQKCRLTELLIKKIHTDNFHPGLQTLHFLISQQFWILSARRAIRRSLSRCFKCFRLNPKPLQPYMGNLPTFRVSQIKPFSIVGVDYGGPFMVTLGKCRGVKSQKAYLCLFVCSATKAVHLELASDLSTEAFLACLRRFIARRGRCTKIFSDQGTNFIGASNELRKIVNTMQDCAAQEKIEWCFNPPSSPHFGGLFEAGIKSAKTHLFRVIGAQILTFEELYTVICQVESLLNSRPLCPLSSDPSDLSVLTPGHFLTLEPLTALPEHNVQHLPLNHLNRWQLLQRLHQDFWKRWHNSYLNTLQQRLKWNKESPSLKENSIVLIKSDLNPPLSWKLGRVIELHRGKDGIARVATLRTASGQLQRPMVKLCPLPEL